jgi:sugar/nucleoside kinase (ribokinase family)
LAFLDAITNQGKLVIGDDSEFIRLFEVDTLEEAVKNAAEYDCVFAMTRSEKGSVIVNGEETVVQEAYPVEEVIDTTGAGDAYAAAFLFGWVSDKSLQECADLGSFAGAAVIQQVGARLEKDFLKNSDLSRP